MNRESRVSSILEGLSINKSKKDDLTYIATFSDGYGTYSRILMSDKRVSETQAEKFYKSFCKENNYEFYSLKKSDCNSKMAKDLIKSGRVDSYK